MSFVRCPLLGTQQSFGQEGKITDTQTLSGVGRGIGLWYFQCFTLFLVEVYFQQMGRKIVLKKEEQCGWERKKILKHRGVIFTILRFIFSQLLGLSFYNNWNFLLFMQRIGSIFCGKDIDALGSGTRWQWVTGVIGARPPQWRAPCPAGSPQPPDQIVDQSFGTFCWGKKRGSVRWSGGKKI